jgi:LmbE family N-acetylglucosaminyl deacetylase
VTHDALPPCTSVLVVCAHPDDESFGLGAVLSTVARQGSRVSVLCFTHGEASTLHGVAGDLTTLRPDELAAAGDVLGVDRVELLDYADNALTSRPLDELAAHVRRVAADVEADALLVFDDGGVTGHPDHQRATDAARRAAAATPLAVLAWALPEDVARRLNEEFATSFAGRPDAEVDIVMTVDRSRQIEAIACHRSQALDNPVLWRRLDMLGDVEHLRYLH